MEITTQQWHCALLGNINYVIDVHIIMCYHLCIMVEWSWAFTLLGVLNLII